MAREEEDREDLLAEATAYVERIAWQIPESGAVWFAGFRRDGAPSFYFHAEPVYHFNSAGELRRAHVRGDLFKAERGQLVQLKRERSPDEVTLASRELAPAEMELFLAEASEMLASLESKLAEGALPLLGQVPLNGNVALRVQAWLAGRPPLRISNTPRAGKP